MLMRLDGDKWFDEVHITTVPRFKQSGLSGDEWRHSFLIEFKRKGIMLIERTVNDFDAALHIVGGMRYDNELVSTPLSTQDKLDKLCMQPGCSAPGTRRFRMTTSGCGRCGHLRDLHHEKYERLFCEEHHVRGNSNLDDMDEHYIEESKHATRA